MPKFNLLTKLLPPEEKMFYKFFEDSTQVCKDTAVLFSEIMHNELKEEHVIRAKTLKHTSDALLRETLYKLSQTFVTPIEREDIQLIAIQLNKITKGLARVCVNLELYRIPKFTENMKKQSDTLLNATDELVDIIHKFRKVSSLKEITESNMRMKEIERHGDEIYHNAMSRLFSGEFEAIDVIKLRSIHEDIERALDKCFLVSDEIVNIVLKQS